MTKQNIDRFVGVMMPQMDEKTRRIFLAAFSEYLGTARPSASSSVRIRAHGAGRKSLRQTYPQIENDLLQILEGNTVGNPENPLCWTTKSLRDLAQALEQKGYSISYVTVGHLLEEMGFSLQQNRKYTEAGVAGPDRDEQFHFILELSKQFIAQQQPVVSVDTKKKELVGNYKNGGAEYCPKGQPIKVEDHDFGKDKACPYGVYDIHVNEGFVNVGISADTGAFAVNSIGSWWETMGKERYPDAKRLMITADGGGSNGRRHRLWKTSLQKFANATGLEIHVSHFPPGTSKWNKIEHRMFAYISKNWPGRPLETYEVIVNLIASTTTSTGLKIKCQLDTTDYPRGSKISDKEMASLNLKQKDWHGEWNYVISPHA